MQKGLTMKVKIKKLHKNAKLPTFGTEDSAGMDLYVLEGKQIYPGVTEMFRTGISMEIPKGYVGLIFARSSTAGKKDLAPANKVGVVDSDYRGEVLIPLHNHGKNIRTVETGERVAQMMIVKHAKIDLEEVDELTKTNRGEGGFGSTGEM